jgi:hypothetical protein
MKGLYSFKAMFRATSPTPCAPKKTNLEFSEYLFSYFTNSTFSWRRTGRVVLVFVSDVGSSAKKVEWSSPKQTLSYLFER